MYVSLSVLSVADIYFLGYNLPSSLFRGSLTIRIEARRDNVAGNDGKIVCANASSPSGLSRTDLPRRVTVSE